MAEKEEEIIEDLSKYDLPFLTLSDIKLENIISNKILTSPMLLGGVKMKLGSGNKCMGFLPDKGLWLGHADYDSAPVRISIDGEISGTGFSLTEISGDLDDVDDGTTYKKVGGVNISHLITNDSVNDVSVAKLTAGSITSKAITLAVAAGTGDTKIQAGKTDFGDTTSGFILGIDDSDSDTPKFEIGDASDYLSWNGTNLDFTGGRRLEKYTAGENIDDGDMVCIIGNTFILSPTNDGYVEKNNANTNYGTATFLYSRGADAFERWIYLTFDTSSISEKYIYKAILHLWCQGVNIEEPWDVVAVRLDEPDSDFDEDTETWNTKPAIANGINEKYLDDSILKVSGQGWNEFDVTQYLRNSGKSFYVRIDQSHFGDPDLHQYYIISKEHIDDTKHPYLEIITTSGSDEKIYKAQADSFENYRAIIGIAQEDITAESDGLVQVDGIITNITDGNQSRILYLSYLNAGGIGAKESGANIVRVGRTIGTNKIKLDIQKENLFIQEMNNTVFPTMADDAEITINTFDECNRVRIIGENETIETVYRGEANEVEEIYTKWSITWNTPNTLTIKNISGGDANISRISFYT
jgi:hypothetical protein